MSAISAKAAVKDSLFDSAYKAALRAAANADYSSLPHREQLGLKPERVDKRSSFRKMAGAVRRGNFRAVPNPTALKETPVPIDCCCFQIAYVVSQ